MTPQAGRVAVEHSGLTRIDSSFGQSKGLDSNVAFLQRVRSKKVWKMELCNDIQYVFTVDFSFSFDAAMFRRLFLPPAVFFQQT